MDQKWLANGSAVLVLDAGNGEPTIGDGNNGQKPNPDYRPALVAVLATEYHEPGQVLDADPLAEVDTAALADYGRTAGASVPSLPAPAPQAIPGPATATKTTTSTAAEDPNVTAPGSAAAVGTVSAAQIIATIRDLDARAEAGDADAQAALDELNAAFDAEEADELADPTATTLGDRTQPDSPETASGGNGVAAESAAAAHEAPPAPPAA